MQRRSLANALIVAALMAPVTGLAQTAPTSGVPNNAPPAGPAQSAGTPPAGPPGTPVTVTPAGKRDVPVLFGNIGTVQAMQTALIRVRVDGTLQEIYFQEGAEVKKGDRLALIDPAPYQAAYDQAVARRAADLALLNGAQLVPTRLTL